MGYPLAQIALIRQGLCVDCEKPHTTGRVRCLPCDYQIRIQDAIRFRKRKLDDLVASPAVKRRLAEIWEYLGILAEPGLVQSVYDLEQREPVRFIFFRWLFDSRKRYVDQDFGDHDDVRTKPFGASLNELITDSLQYAATVPDPLKEIQEWQLKREIETRGRTPLAIAMTHYDGMTAEDFEVVRPLYA